MPYILSQWWRRIDWLLLSAALLLVGAGLITMSSFGGESYFFDRQLIWVGVSLAAFFVFSLVDWRFLRRSGAVVALYLLNVAALLFLVTAGWVVQGAQSWFVFGGVFFQPSDFMKLVLILILAKYFARRHIEIAHIRHILVSGLYAAIPFILILLQPDLGVAVIIFLIWLGMVIFAGISPKHLLLVFLVAAAAAVFLWSFVLAPYQRQRIISFAYPLADIRGVGYSAFQSTIAVGSGRVLGGGVGYGTQSRLKFLPEYETDFIFAAFAEEWGFVGAAALFAVFGFLVWRIIGIAMVGAANFETLFGVGLAITLMSHFIISVGMNIGLLPVTGLTLPFISYGGSHLLAEFSALGILMGMRGYARSYHRDDVKKEFLGLG